MNKYEVHERENGQNWVVFNTITRQVVHVGVFLTREAAEKCCELYERKAGNYETSDGDSGEE